MNPFIVFLLVVCSTALTPTPAFGVTPAELATLIRAEIDALYPEIEKLYIDLHQNPELSLQEEKSGGAFAPLAVESQGLSPFRSAVNPIGRGLGSGK